MSIFRTRNLWWAGALLVGPVYGQEGNYTTVVTGTRTEVRAEDSVVATEVITRRQIETSGAKDLAELLSTHPGVEVIWSFRGAGVRIQGLDPEYVLVLLDGERVSGRVGGWIDLSRYSLRDVERVEIIKGPASALYGSDAMGGVINLITRKIGRDFEATGKGSYGTRGEVELRGGAGLSRQGLELRLGGGHRSAEPFDLNPADVATTGSGFGRVDVDGSGQYRFSDQVVVRSQVGYLRKDERAIDLGPSGAVFDRRERIEQFEASLRSRLGLSERGALALRAHHSLFRDQLLQDQRGAAFLDSYADSVERLYEVGAQWEQHLDAAGKHLVVAGSEMMWEQLTSPRLVQGQGARQRLAFFAQDEWQVLSSPRLWLSPGLRWDFDSQFGEHPSPRLAVRFDPFAALTLRGAYGWGYRSPNFQELLLAFENPSVGYVVEGNPLLKPERSQGINLSADYRIGNRATLSASLFRTDIQDLIAIVNLPIEGSDLPTRFGYGNVASAMTQGGEASARVRVYEGVYLDAGFTLTDTLDRQRNRPLEGRPLQRVTFQLSGRHRRTGLEATLRGAWVGARPFYFDVDGDGTEDTHWTVPFTDFDVWVGWRINPHARVFVGGNNLLNAVDADFLARPPRGFFGGLSGEY